MAFTVLLPSRAANPAPLQTTCCQRARNHYLIAVRALSAPRMMGSSRRADRQMLNRFEAWHAAPLDLGLVHRQLESRPAPKQGLERARTLDARELMAKAEVNSGTEGDMPVRLSLKIELLRICICLRIQVRGRQHGHDLLALPELHPAKFDVFSHVARLGELHGREEPQEFLDRKIGPAPILFEPIAQPGTFQKLIFPDGLPTHHH